MPVSYEFGKQQAKEWIESLIDEPEFTIYDLGCGLGTYGELITKPCTKVGVDAVDYHKAGEWGKKYSWYSLNDVRDTARYLTQDDYRMDMAILGDVLEHLEVEDAQKLINRLKQSFRYILVAVPYLHKQKSKNHYEVHRQDDLTPELFDERYPGFKLLYQEHNRRRPIYGYYTWERG